MGGFIEPNIHPVIVHFGFALIVTALLAYLLGFRRPVTPRSETLTTAGDWMLAFGIVAIIATAASGLWAYYTVAHDGPSHAAMTLHRNWALPTAGAVLFIGAWRWTQRVAPPTLGFLATFGLVCASLTATAWLGGKLVYQYGLGVQQLPVVAGQGHDDGHDHDHGPEIATKADPDAHARHDGSSEDLPLEDMAAAGPSQIADMVGQALKTENAAALEALFLPSVIIAEGGAAERSFEEYASHHMISDMAYVGATTAQTVKRDVIDQNGLAVVVTESLITGRFREKDVRNRLMETLTLQRTDAGWRIAHVHWSSGAAPEATGPSHSHDDHEHVEPDASTEGAD